LANCLRSKDYNKALRIAFKLDKPMKTLQIFEQVMKDAVTTTQDGKPDGTEARAKADAVFGELLSQLSVDNVEKCLLYIRDWNTNAKHSLISQKVLNHILQIYSPDSLLKLPRIREVRLAGV